MSAYVVDPRTIDYLVQWAAFHKSSHNESVKVPQPGTRDYRFSLDRYTHGNAAVYLREIPQNLLGQILLDENVRSVQARYPDTVADPSGMPGPNDQTRVRSYQFQPVPHKLLKAAWVIQSCDCLDYQSCETSDWEDTLAYRIVQAIRESAIGAITEGAPWGVTDSDLTPEVVGK